MKYLKRLITFSLITFTLLYSTIAFAADYDITTYSPTCLLMETKTGKIIYEKNAYEKKYPASTTKIMTAILTLEHCELTDTAIASYEAVFSVPSRIY